MASDLEILFGGDASGLLATIGEVKSALGGIAGAAKDASDEAEGGFSGFIESLKGGLESIEGLKSALEGFAAMAASAFAVREIEEFTESMANLGLQTEKAHAILGMSNADIAALSIVAANSGTSLEALEVQFARFAKGIEEGSKNAKAGLATIGLSIEQLKGEDLTTQLEQVAKAFAQLPEGPLKTAAAMELFGRGGAAMLLVLENMSKGMQTWRDEAERTGTVISGPMLEAMEQTHGLSVELGKSLEGLGIAIYGQLAVPINATISLLTEMFEALKESATGTGLLAEALRVAGDVVRLVEAAVVVLVAGFEMLGHVLDLALTEVTAFGTGLHNVVEDALKPAAQVLADIEEGFSKLASGDIAGAAASFGKAFSENLFGDTTKAWDATLAKMKEAWGAYTEANRTTMRRLIDEFAVLDGATKKSAEGVGQIDEATKKANESAAELRRKFEEVMGSVKDSGGAIDDLNEKIKTLEEGIKAGLAAGTPTGLTAATGSAAELIKHFEGFQSSAFFDKNAYRVGWSSDTMTDAAGKVTSVTKDSTTTIEDANRDLARRVAEYTQQAANQIGEAWNKLSENAKASIVSVMYNYGSLPGTIKAAAAEGDAAVARAIASLDANKARRQAEADNITGIRPDRSKEAGKAIDDLTDKRTKLQEKEAGGSEAEKAKVKALEDEARGAGNVLKADEAQVAALEKQLSMYRTAEARGPIEQKLAEAKLKLEEDTNKAKEAGLKLDLEKAKGTGDPGKEHAAATALADARIADAKARYGEDSAEHKKAIAEKQDADNKFASDSAKRTKEQVDEEIKTVKYGAEQKRKALDDELEHKRISTSSYLAQIKAINAEEEADTKKLYDQEIALAGQTEAQKIAIKNKEADELRAINAKETEDSRKAANQSEKEWENAIGGILSTFSSAIKGMISGHETFRQAATKALEQLADKAIDMFEKMLTKWIATQLAQTTATTTGVAARTAAEQAGSTAGMAANAMSMLKSIFGSAGQAFAGVFGFLSPVMGPAAAGPAAAAEATVIGTGSSLVSADIGMWKVPSDQMALVHRSELVMPAAQADAFRSMLTGSNPIGSVTAGSGVSIHPSIAMNVRAVDASGFKGWFRDNQRGIMQGMNSAARQGAHLGMRALV
jgi:GH24 family phage-related lysozyme (muramidase)